MSPLKDLKFLLVNKKLASIIMETSSFLKKLLRYTINVKVVEAFDREVSLPSPAKIRNRLEISHDENEVDPTIDETLNFRMIPSYSIRIDQIC